MERIIHEEMAAKAHKRQFTRAQVQMQVQVTPAQGAPITGQVLNLSLNGVLLTLPSPLPAGQECCVAISLEGMTEPESVNLKGHVVRSQEQTVAITFEETDSDSVQHLRNLVAYNSGRGEQIDREFVAYFGLLPTSQTQVEGRY